MLNSTRFPRGHAPRSTLGALLICIAACGGSEESVPRNSNSTPGSVVDHPEGGFFIADANEQGNAAEVYLTRVMYGRLVEVFGLDSAGLRVLMGSDFLIAPDLVSDGQAYEIGSNPVTAGQFVLILRDVTDEVPGGGREQFFELLKMAEQNVIPVEKQDSSGAGLYSMVPRNASIGLQFSDLIDASTLSSQTVRLLTGTPPSLPFEGRVLTDPNHGDLAEHDGLPGLEFYSTRIIYDLAVTEIESFTTEPPLPVNSIGLPDSVEVNLANFELRIPTTLSPATGQTELLTNASGHPLATVGNAPLDYGTPSMDVVRAARSGGSNDVTGDPYNGFLPDREAPRIVGVQPARISETPVHLGGSSFLVPEVRFDSEFCAQTPEPGDVLVQLGVYAEVSTKPVQVNQGVLKNVQVRLLLYPSMWDAQGGPVEWLKSAKGLAEFQAAFDEHDDADRQACFVRILPEPVGFPELPNVGVHTSSSFSLRFSEPMDPQSVTAFDSMTLTRQPVNPDNDPPLPTNSYVVGEMHQSADLTQFTFTPDLPLAHELGQQEAYYLSLAPGEASSTDLSGNGLEMLMPQVTLTIDPVAADQRNGGRVSRFRVPDEEAPFGGQAQPLPEWSGQHLYDLQRELIAPRPVVRYQGLVDNSQPVPSLMTSFAQGVQTPLSNLGSKCQTLWRYCDFGYSLTDASKFNIDVESLYWSPAGGTVMFDTFEEFEIRLAHSKYTPDEYVNFATNLPKFGNSGLANHYTKNVLDNVNDPLKIMHPKHKGYQINPGELLVASTGTRLFPFPLNRDNTPEEWQTYTWRNTSLRSRGAPGGGGLDLWQVYYALNKTRPFNPYFTANNARTSGLPLLLEFRCYPDEGAAGQNPFQIVLASNSAPQPYFRAFSTGGVRKNGKIKRVNPDLETKANGGFNPTSNPPGEKTPGNDPVVYIGASDFVVRVSRSHSLWFAADDPLLGGPFPAPTYSTPVTEPRPESQPQGTALEINFRGMTAFEPPTDECTGEPVMAPLENALTMDLYGDHYNDDCIPNPNGQPNHSKNFANKGITFLGDVDDWKDTVFEIDGAPYYQVRLTFESNIFSGLSPELSALAISWTD